MKNWGSSFETLKSKLQLVDFFFLVISGCFRVIRWFRKVFTVLLGENELKNEFSTQKPSPLHRFFRHHNDDRILGGYPTHDMLFDSISNTSSFFFFLSLPLKKEKRIKYDRGTLARPSLHSWPYLFVSPFIFFLISSFKLVFLLDFFIHFELIFIFFLSYN